MAKKKRSIPKKLFVQGAGWYEPAIANVQRACSTNPEYGDLWRELRLLEEKVIAFETHGEGFSGS